MKLKLLPIFLSTLFCLSFLTGCVSNTSYSENPETVKKVGDVTFVVRHLSKSELIKRHGKENNPYVGRPKGLVFDTIVFEVEISSTETTLFFITTDCQLSIEGNTESADNRMRFMADWENYTINAQERQVADYYAIQHTVRKTMFKNKVVFPRTTIAVV